MSEQPFYHTYGYNQYNRGRFKKPASHYNCRNLGFRYQEVKQHIQQLIAQLPGVSIMATPEDDVGIEPQKKDMELVDDEFVSTDRPTCKSLQKDLEKVHTIVRKVKGDVTRLITGLEELNDVLSAQTEETIKRVTVVETKSDNHEVRLKALKDKLAMVVQAENVTLQASPTLEADHALLKQRVDTAAVVISSLEKQIQSANSRILHNSQLHNANHYRISGIRFVEGEDSLIATTTFLKDIMEITVNDRDIVVASRLPGTITVRIKGEQVKLPPQMFVKVTPHLQKRIAANIQVLDGKTDPVDGHYYKVKQQLPDAAQAARQHFNKVVGDVQEKNKTKPKEERVPFYFQGADLFVGGKKVKEPVTPPSRASMLTISPKQQESLDTISFEQLAYEERDGSKFFGYAVRVYNISLIKKLYTRMRKMHLAANHIMLAYCVETPEDLAKCVEGSCSDGESHGDVVLARLLETIAMKNVAVFIVRYFGGTPLRGLRLKLIGDCARKALNKLRFPDADDHDVSRSTPNEENIPSSSHSSTPSPRCTPDKQVFDHGYSRTPPIRATGPGRGGMSSFAWKSFRSTPIGKKPKLDFESAMEYSIEY